MLFWLMDLLPAHLLTQWCGLVSRSSSQSDRQTARQWGPPAWHRHLAVIRIKNKIRANTPIVLVFQCVNICESACVSIFEICVCTPISSKTMEQKLKCRNRKLNLKGSERDLYSQGPKGSSAEGKRRRGGGSAFTKRHALQSTWPFYLCCCTLIRISFDLSWEYDTGNLSAINGWLFGWIIGATWNKMQQREFGSIR